MFTQFILICIIKIYNSQTILINKRYIYSLQLLQCDEKKCDIFPLCLRQLLKIKIGN